MNKKTAASLAIALLISLAGCGGTAGTGDIPSINIESQAPSETPETAPEETAGTDPAQDAPSQSGELPEAAQDPAASEKPPEAASEPTTRPEQAAPTDAPASSAPASAPTAAPTPDHTHSYTSTVTKQASCKAEGVRTYTCSCGDSYTEAIGKTDSHNWATRHFDEVGHYESSGTHTVRFNKCHCGFIVTSDDPNATEVWEEHYFNCGGRCIFGTMEVPNGEPQYVVDTPAHDETYCTICGTVK